LLENGIYDEAALTGGVYFARMWPFIVLWRWKMAMALPIFSSSDSGAWDIAGIFIRSIEPSSLPFPRSKKNTNQKQNSH